MALSYGVIALISLCMVGVCVAADKKRDIWLLLVFVSVSLCNLGYFMISVSQNLGAALNSNRIAYLGSVFLPFFMLMMVLRFCGMNRTKTLMITLVTVCVLMLGITTSPGILPIYYSTVDIAFVNGSTQFLREYGPLHALYYVYLIGYMLSMVGVVIYAIVKKKISSPSHTILLLCTVLCNIAIWLAEQFLPRGFEWLSVSYILTECLILGIYHSMQKQGLMSRKGSPRILDGKRTREAAVLEAYIYDPDVPENDLEVMLKANMGKQCLKQWQQGWLVLDDEEKVGGSATVIV